MEFAMVDKRIQFRGVCCACGRVHALKGDMMVQHGYTVDYGMFNGSCQGVGHPHYGHVDAPKYLKQLIEESHDLLARLPAMIACCRDDLARAEAAYEKAKAISRTEGRQALEARNNLKNQLKACMYALNGGVKASIDMYEKMHKEWVQVEPMEVDLVVEAAEQRAARKALADAKKQAKADEQAAKKRVAEEREAKEKLAARMAELAAGAYCRLYYRGKLVKEFKQSFEDERSLLNAYHSTRQEHYLTIFPDTSELNWNLGSYFFEARDKPDGKGKRLEHYLLGGTPKSYFEVDWD
jgi:hypothetical protein